MQFFYFAIKKCMAFERKSGGDQGFIERTVSSLALVVGDLVAYNRSAYKVQKATAASEASDLAGVVAEAATTASTIVKLQTITPWDEYIADTANESNVEHNYQRMLLSDENTVNNAGTDNTTDEAVFIQTGVVGAAADKKIIGRFDLFKKTA